MKKIVFDRRELRGVYRQTGQKKEQNEYELPAVNDEFG